MTNNNFLEILAKVKKHIGSGDIYGANILLEDSIKRAQIDAIADASKKSGNHTRQKAVNSLYKDMQKSAKESCSPWRERQHKSATTGKYYITDGYTAVESDTPFPGIEEQVNNPYDYSKLFPNDSGEDLPAPSAPTLRAWIKSEKASGNTVALMCGKSSVLFDYGEGKPAFDAKLLLRAIEITNNSAPKIVARGRLSPACLKSSDGVRVVLCPVKVSETMKRRDCMGLIKYMQGENNI